MSSALQLNSKVRCMAKLIYSMLTSLDGYIEDEHGAFGWGAPADEAVHTYVNELASSVGTYLYGRRMYETMVYWETAHTIPNQPQRADANRAGVRPGGGPPAEGERRPRHHRRRSGARRACDTGRSRRRARADRLPRDRRRGKAVLPGACATGPGPARGAPVRQRRDRPPICRPPLNRIVAAGGAAQPSHPVRGSRASRAAVELGR